MCGDPPRKSRCRSRAHSGPSTPSSSEIDRPRFRRIRFASRDSPIQETAVGNQWRFLIGCTCSASDSSEVRRGVFRPEPE